MLLFFSTGNLWSRIRAFNPRRRERVPRFISQLTELVLPIRAGQIASGNVDNSRLVFATQEHGIHTDAFLCLDRLARLSLRKTTPAVTWSRGRACTFYSCARASGNKTAKSRAISRRARTRCKWKSAGSVGVASGADPFFFPPPFPSGIISLRPSHACHHTLVHACIYAHTDSARASRVRPRVVHRAKHRLSAVTGRRERERRCNSFTRRFDASVSSRRPRAFLRKWLLYTRCPTELAIRSTREQFSMCSLNEKSVFYKIFALTE